ncbi:MAG: alpha-xylosidase, partial [Propionibacteriaceae bacterium]|nr:alpha-xylosidase [Propionibacteriaceae bacterium]
MKFSDGYWRPAPGFDSLFALEAGEVVELDGGFTVHAPIRPVEHLRNTLNNPVIAVTLWSPFPDAIGVKIVHHGGTVRRPPAFELTVDPGWRPSVHRTADEVSLRAGDLSAHLRLNSPWHLEFRRRGELVTASGHRSIATATARDGDAHTYQRLLLPDGDLVYGLGERSTALVRNGQSIDTWNDDGGPSSWHSYKAIPFFLTDHSWGVFVDSPGRVSYEVGSEFTSQVQFSVPGQRLEYVVLAGDTPKDVLSRYTRLTGRPVVPPAWSFGLWLSTSFVTDHDQTTMARFVDEMAARDMPVGVVHFDSFWMREFRWCDFEWDPARFPDPPSMLAALHAKGARVCVWINPYIAERSALFNEAAEAGYLLRRPNGDVWQQDTWQAGMGIVDFTNPHARDWYAGKLRALCASGIDCFKTDFGERIPLDVVFHDGSDPALAHNYYSYLYNRTVVEAIEAVHGSGEGVVFARS